MIGATRKSGEAEGIVSRLEPGGANFFVLGEADRGVVFLVRERTSMIKYLGETGIGIRGALFREGEVLVVAVAIRAGQYLKQEYVTWWDYHREETAFWIMVSQEYIPIFFHGDNAARERACITANRLRAFFSAAVQNIPTLPSWDGPAFNNACRKIRDRFSTSLEIWQAGQPE